MNDVNDMLHAIEAHIKKNIESPIREHIDDVELKNAHVKAFSKIRRLFEVNDCEVINGVMTVSIAHVPVIDKINPTKKLNDFI